MFRLSGLVLIIFSLVFVSSCKEDKKAEETSKETKKEVSKPRVKIPRINQDSTYYFVKKQTEFGPRVMGSEAHTACKNSPNDINVDPQVTELADRNTAFGFDILKKIYQESPDSNVFISPLSISLALAMTMNGADGTTKTEMQNTMRLDDLDLNTINASFKELLTILPDIDENVNLKLANSIWYAPTFTIYQDFLNDNSNYYNSEVHETEVSPEALATINDWCKEHTDGLIEEVIKAFPPDFIMFLINAIYFKGSWTQEFDEENTYESYFYLNNGETKLVDMMDYKGLVNLPYFENEKFQSVDLDYGNGDFSMSVFLPKSGFSVTDIMNDVNSENWQNWIGQFQSDSIYLNLPKFKLEYEKKLKDILISLGMESPFSEGSKMADFSKMTNVSDAHISQVFHKSFLEVNEKGTEAAAVTVVEVVTESVSEDPHFIANKPFLFFIRESQTHSILFSGVLMDPETD